jgi:hypothetical protein
MPLSASGYESRVLHRANVETILFEIANWRYPNHALFLTSVKDPFCIANISCALRL